MKLICVALLMPASGLLEKLACVLVRDSKKPEEIAELDDRLLAAPTVALERSHALTVKMADDALAGMKDSLRALLDYSPELAEGVRKLEDKGDHYEDILGTYLVKISSRQLNEHESSEAAKLLRLIGDYERISDHSVNVIESAEEIREKKLELSANARAELAVLTSAVEEVLTLSHRAFVHNDLQAAAMVEPLEQVIDQLKEQMRAHHIIRLQQGDCSIEAGFVWNDLLTNLERVSDHCFNISLCMLETHDENMNLHQYRREAHENQNATYDDLLRSYTEKYSLKGLRA